MHNAQIDCGDFFTPTKLLINAKMAWRALLIDGLVSKNGGGLMGGKGSRAGRGLYLLLCIIYIIYIYILLINYSGLFCPDLLLINYQAFAGAFTPILIALPLPPRELQPNRSPANRRRAVLRRSAARRYRTMARVAAMAVAPPEPWQQATARVTFFHAVRRRRDRDNALASLKSAFDGIVDGGVLADDAGLTFGPVGLEIDRESPRVEIEVQGE